MVLSSVILLTKLSTTEWNNSLKLKCCRFIHILFIFLSESCTSTADTPDHINVSPYKSSSKALYNSNFTTEKLREEKKNTLYKEKNMGFPLFKDSPGHEYVANTSEQAENHLGKQRTS